MPSTSPELIEADVEPEAAELLPSAVDRRRPSWRRRLAGAVVVLALGGSALAVWTHRGPTNSAIEHSRAITAAQLEAQYGVRLGNIGLLASGGLVELKFQVIDADKATALFGETEDMPLLAVEGTSFVLESAKGMKHSLTLLDGASYFFLYTNVSNSLHDGSTVAFVINGERVPNLLVRQ